MRMPRSLWRLFRSWLDCCLLLLRCLRPLLRLERRRVIPAGKHVATPRA